MYLGAVPMATNGGGALRQSIFYPRTLPLPVWPSRPQPQPPIGIVTASDRGSVSPIATPVSTSPPQPPAPMPASVAGTPVPAGFPTNQIFVNSDGSFWQYSPSQGVWVNVGTPYGTGASATPPAPPPSSTGSSTLPPSTVAPAPVSASVAPIVTGTSYQDILDWLNEDSLLGTLGFAGIPNWITGAGVALLVYKVAGKQGRR